MNVATPSLPMRHPVPLAIIVDPDADTRKLHALTLQSVASDIDEAEDGADALAHVLMRPPGLVVTELRLPRIDGFALCGLIREEPSTRDATILVVTGSAMPVQIERARRAGADDVLLKPADPDRVRDTARALVLRARQLRATSGPTRQRVAEEFEHSRALLERSEAAKRRLMSRTHARERTTTPPEPPPVLRCPVCDQALAYDHSNVGGVSARFSEQWDYLSCARCGTFQYRHRTRRLRQI